MWIKFHYTWQSISAAVSRCSSAMRARFNIDFTPTTHCEPPKSLPSENGGLGLGANLCKIPLGFSPEIHSILRASHKIWYAAYTVLSGLIWNSHGFLPIWQFQKDIPYRAIVKSKFICQFPRTCLVKAQIIFLVKCEFKLNCQFQRIYLWTEGRQFHPLHT